MLNNLDLALLCQDCLGVMVAKDKNEFMNAHALKIKCECDGDLCGCSGCQEDIKMMADSEQLEIVNGINNFISSLEDKPENKEIAHYILESINNGRIESVSTTKFTNQEIKEKEKELGLKLKQGAVLK